MGPHCECHNQREYRHGHPLCGWCASAATAGAGFIVTVTAEDQFNNPAIGYTGTVVLSGGDAGAILGPNAQLTSGVGDFSVTLATAGTQIITASDSAIATITGASGPILVSTATTVTHFVITPPIGSAATAGNAFAFLVQAEDAFNNQVPSYSGTLHFTTTDAADTLPANVTLVTGFGAFLATFRTARALRR